MGSAAHRRSESIEPESNVVKLDRNEPDEETRQVYQAFNPTRELSADDLKWMWMGGVIDKASYIGLALWLEGDKKKLNFEDFAARWKGHTNPETNKAKELKPEDVEKVFSTLKSKDQVQAAQMEISFTLNY